MKYYKIVFGYGQDDSLPITQDELPKAFALFMEGKGRGLFTEGAIRAQDIQRIVPDWHTAKGWNKGYKMTPEDWKEVYHLEEPYRDMLKTARDIAEFAIKENRRDLLTQPITTSYMALPQPEPTLKKEVELLADKFKA